MPLSAELPVARDAMRAALGDVRLQPEGDGLYAVLEDTADRFCCVRSAMEWAWLRAACNLTKLRVR